jgi:hypothetical protein
MDSYVFFTLFPESLLYLCGRVGLSCQGRRRKKKQRKVIHGNHYDYYPTDDSGGPGAGGSSGDPATLNRSSISFLHSQSTYFHYFFSHKRKVKRLVLGCRLGVQARAAWWTMMVTLPVLNYHRKEQDKEQKRRIKELETQTAERIQKTLANPLAGKD